MTKTEAIEQARRIYERKGSVEVPEQPDVLDPPTCPGQVSEPGTWVRAWVKVPSPVERAQDALAKSTEQIHACRVCLKNRSQSHG